MDYASDYKLKLIIEYEGSGYWGWQIQPNRETVQEVVEKTLKIFLNAEYKKQGKIGFIDRVKVKASGRTDRGVHARGQVISVAWPVDLDLDLHRLKGAINGISPRNVSFLDIEKVSSAFDAQYSAISKHYRYLLSTRIAPLCLDIGRSWRVGGLKDIASLQQCLSRIVGTHDFSSFRASDCVARTTIRTIESAYLETFNGGENLELNFVGTGFLKNMVRYIVASFVEVAKGNKDITYVEELIDLKPRDPRIKLAPPDGLYLMQVNYEIIDYRL